MSASRAAALTLVASGALAANASALTMCPDSSIVDSSSDWVWSHGAAPTPSCTSPYAQDTSHMCAGDPTSIVMQSHGETGCYVTKMADCKFNMRDLQQLDFDLRMVDCKGTWAAPLWLTPDHWAGGGKSGEIDMVEVCPTHHIYSNFAGATAPVGQQKRWDFADPDGFSGHVTMWQSNGAVRVQMCTDAEAASNGGACGLSDDAAYYADVFSSNACADGQDCIFTFVSDIWNGVAGDGGFEGCRKGLAPSTRDCRYSVRNIQIQGPSFAGNCAALSTRRRSTPRRRSAPRRRRGSSWQPCEAGSAACCDPNSSIQQYCPGGEACQPCGSSACQCPSGVAEMVV